MNLLILTVVYAIISIILLLIVRSNRDSQNKWIIALKFISLSFIYFGIIPVLIFFKNDFVLIAFSIFLFLASLIMIREALSHHYLVKAGFSTRRISRWYFLPLGEVRKICYESEPTKRYKMIRKLIQDTNGVVLS